MVCLVLQVLACPLLRLPLIARPSMWPDLMLLAPPVLLPVPMLLLPLPVCGTVCTHLGCAGIWSTPRPDRVELEPMPGQPAWFFW